MAAEEIYQIYRRYVGAINAGRWDQMPEYIADPAVFDGVKMSPLQYGQTIASFSSTCESFYVELLDVVIDATQGRIAAKLVASGKPIMEFFGFQPTGNQVRFNQAAFYKMENGKITNVTTIVDRADIAESLAGKK